MIQRAALFLLASAAFSGLAALAEEVLFARMFTTLFGAGTASAVATAAGFMLGLGLGALAGARRAQAADAAGALRWLALLELGIGGFAATAGVWGKALDALLALAAAHCGGGCWQALRFAAGLFVLALPALAMGAGFAFAVAGARALGVSLGALYGLNTFAGALGALLPLALLPMLGWARALLVVALGNLVAAALAFLAARAESGAAHPDVSAPASASRARLMAYALVGAAALALEVGWVRLFGAALLRTEYVMGILLAAYLAGVGLGGMLAARIGSARWIAPAGWLAALAAAASVLLWPRIAAWAQGTDFTSLAAAMSWQGLAVFAAIVPTTLALGAWLPWAAEEGEGARWYAANSLGGAIGALAAGLAGFPVLGAQRLVVVAALLLGLATLVWGGRRALAGLVLFVPVAALAWPLVPAERLAPSLARAHELARHEDIVAWTIVAEEPSGDHVLISDLLRMDAATDPTSVMIQRHQAILPLLLHPHPKRVLFLGLGSGITLSGAAGFAPKKIVAVEIAKGAIAAAQGPWFRPLQRGMLARAEIVHADARAYLRRTHARFDVIIGDLFHPDLAGRGMLISYEQFARARARLAPGGVFVQWLALNQFDVPTLQIVLRTFARVFPDALVFIDGYRLALVGANGPLAGIARTALAWQERLDASALEGEDAFIWLGRCWGLARRAAGEGPVQREWQPVVEYRLPRVRIRGIDLAATWRWLLSWRMDAKELARLLGVPEEDWKPFARAWAATGLLAHAWRASLEGRADKAREYLAAAYSAAPQNRWAAWGLADAILARAGHKDEALDAALRIAPDHPDALVLAWMRAVRTHAPEAGALQRRLCAQHPLLKHPCAH